MTELTDATKTPGSLDPSGFEDLFSRVVDGDQVDFVRPLEDSDRLVWVAYDRGHPLGTLTGSVDSEGVSWRLSTTHERHRSLDDAVRALRRPASWPRERAQVARWARQTLSDPSLIAVDVETTGLDEPWAVQIAAVDRTGKTLINELVNPRAEIEPGAVAVHGITPERVQGAPTFSQLLPRLTEVFRGRLCLAFNVTFDRDCFEREVRRHHEGHGPQRLISSPGVESPAVREWMTSCRWEDAMVPYSVWRGLWRADRGTYRLQRLGGPHDAVGDCLAMLQRMEELANGAPDPGFSQAVRSRSRNSGTPSTFW